MVRWVAAYKEGGRTRPLPAGTHKVSRLKACRVWLLELRRKENDLTLEALGELLLAVHGVAADKSMLSRFFDSEGMRWLIWLALVKLNPSVWSLSVPGRSCARPVRREALSKVWVVIVPSKTSSVEVASNRKSASLQIPNLLNE